MIILKVVLGIATFIRPFLHIKASIFKDVKDLVSSAVAVDQFFSFLPYQEE